MNMKKKIAYISITALSDCDIPLIQELSKKNLVDYYILATNSSRKGTVINIELKEKGGVYKGTQYTELREIEKWIDLDHVYVVNKPVDHDWSWMNLKVSWEWLKMLRKENYDIIHVTWPLRYSSFLIYLLHKRMVLTMHDPIPHSSHLTLDNKFHRWCGISLTPDFILLNKTQRGEFIERYGIEESRVHMSRLSAYVHLMETVPAKPLCTTYILYVGSILSHKGIEYLCEAMESVFNTRENLKVIIAGKGDFYFDKTRYEANPKFMFINRFISNKELASLISNSIAVVCPYIDATQSGVVMSAYALNKPVIATNVGALPEMVDDGRTGFLVPPRDSKALADAIRKMLEPETAQQMSKHIMEDYSSGKNSWKEIANEVEKIYDDIIARRTK